MNIVTSSNSIADFKNRHFNL